MDGTNVVPHARPADAVDDAIWLCRTYAAQPFVDPAERRQHLEAAAELGGLRGAARRRRAKALAEMLAE